MRMVVSMQLSLEMSLELDAQGWIVASSLENRCASIRGKQEHWFTHSFDVILREDIGLNVSDEIIKQLSQFEGDYDAVYKLATLKDGLTDHNDICLAFVTHPQLYPVLLTFFQRCDEYKVTGAYRKKLYEQLAQGTPVDTLAYEFKNEVDYSALIDQVLVANPDKLKDPKLVNWLFGQVMKLIPNKDGLDMNAIKAELQRKLS
jgi:hypothetical protein